MANLKIISRKFIRIRSEKVIKAILQSLPMIFSKLWNSIGDGKRKVHLRGHLTNTFRRRRISMPAEWLRVWI